MPAFLITSVTACVWFMRIPSLPRERRCVPDTETAVPKPRGEGASLIVTVDPRLRVGRVSGHLTGRSPPSRCPPWCTTRRLFTDSDIFAQATVAMDILQKYCSTQTGRYRDFCTEYTPEYLQTVGIIVIARSGARASQTRRRIRPTRDAIVVLSRTLERTTLDDIPTTMIL